MFTLMTQITMSLRPIFEVWHQKTFFQQLMALTVVLLSCVATRLLTEQVRFFSDKHHDLIESNKELNAKFLQEFMLPIFASTIAVLVGTILLLADTLQKNRELAELVEERDHLWARDAQWQLANADLQQINDELVSDRFDLYSLMQRIDRE